MGVTIVSISYDHFCAKISFGFLSSFGKGKKKSMHIPPCFGCSLHSDQPESNDTENFHRLEAMTAKRTWEKNAVL